VRTPGIRILTATLAGVLLTALGACSRADSNDSGGNNPAAAPAADKGPASELRLGYFPNVTHAAALIGLDKGLFAKALGSTKLTPTSFNAGPDEVNALLGGSRDAGIIGSGPTINAFAKSKGEAIRLIAGATSGGAQFVVTPDISKPEDLVGKTVVTPQLGNTQDVSLKKWLSDKGLTGKVQVTNLENAQTLDAFKKGTVQAAWLPEPPRPRRTTKPPTAAPRTIASNAYAIRKRMPCGSSCAVGRESSSSFRSSATAAAGSLGGVALR